MSLLRKQRRAKEAKLKKEAKKGVNPQIQQALSNALALHKAGDLDQAELIYIQILNHQPSNHESLHLFGVVKYQKGNFDDSISLINKAIKLSPKSLPYYNNLGNALIGAGDLEKAVDSYKKALELKPDYLEAVNNIGAALHELGRLEEEIKYYKEAINNAPADTKLLNEIVKTMRDACDWEGLDIYETKLIAATKQALEKNILPPISPYHSLTHDISPILKKEIAVNYANLKFQNIQKPFDYKIEEGEKIRIGYLSSDYRDHPTAHLIQNIFKLHNRDEFEVYTYSYGKDDQSSYRKNIEQNSDHFVDLFGKSSSRIANKINDDKIHILVDIMGYIQNAIPEVLATRPAPLQINYLAYPGTMGTDFIDYLVTDHIAVPNEDIDNYTENLIFMPDTYFITDNNQEITNKNSREDFGLVNDQFVMCSFNKSNKINSQVFDCWAEILKEVENSVLWLLSDNEFTKNNLRNEAIKRGIEPERLIFAGRLPKAEHLERYTHADIFLDCFTVNAHTTAIDSLWAGLPVITMQGNNIISRASASILKANGLPELIATNIEEYKNLVLTYSKDPEKLSAIKNKIQNNRKNKPLFDSEKYVKNLEKGLKKAWELYIGGSKDDIEVI